MWTKLHWVNGPWPGKLAVAARPRGEDWLEDELSSWRQAGIDVVLSMLTTAEEDDLGLRNEARVARAQGMEFISLPVPDRQTPNSETETYTTLEAIERSLSTGKNVLVHCRQGVGRSGLIAACLLIGKGLSPGTAVMDVSMARGVEVPETSEQRNWIDHYAVVLANTK